MEPKIAMLKVVGAVPTVGNPLIIGWDCDENPPGTKSNSTVVGAGRIRSRSRGYRSPVSRRCDASGWGVQGDADAGTRPRRPASRGEKSLSVGFHVRADRSRLLGRQTVAVTLYGPWWLEVVFGETNSGERFTITGSDSADGVYDKRPLSVGIGTAPGMVSGTEWTITFEFSPFGFLDIGQVGPFVIGDWYQSGIVRSATYTVKDYLGDDAELRTTHTVELCRAAGPWLSGRW